jgi:4-hydroxy 2-oxovalerate aldolase
MGTYVPRVLRANTYELCELDFIGQKINSHLTIALQTSLLFGVKTIYLAGFDGYYGESISEQLQELFVENSQILKAASEKIDCISLTPTKYEGISQSSIYNFIK